MGNLYSVEEIAKIAVDNVRICKYFFIQRDIGTPYKAPGAAILFGASYEKMLFFLMFKSRFESVCEKAV